MDGDRLALIDRLVATLDELGPHPRLPRDAEGVRATERITEAVQRLADTEGWDDDLRYAEPLRDTLEALSGMAADEPYASLMLRMARMQLRRAVAADALASVTSGVIGVG